MITVRLATSQDLDAVIAAKKKVTPAEPLYTEVEQVIAENIQAERLYVAETENGEVAGFGMFHIIWGDTAMLALLKVDPDHQGQGVGSQILKAVQDDVASRGYENLLSSTEKINELSQKFHAKSGFEEIGELDMPHGVEYFYKKQLVD